MPAWKDFEERIADELLLVKINIKESDLSHDLSELTLIREHSNIPIS